MDIHEIYHKEEIMRKQRARTTWLKEGDLYTVSFHKTTNAKRRLNTIHCLKVEDTTITEYLIHMHESQRFKELFVKNNEHSVKLQADIRGEILISRPWKKIFKKKKLRRLVETWEGADKAARPDGFPIFSFKTFWELVKKDLVTLLNEISVETARLNR